MSEKKKNETIVGEEAEKETTPEPAKETKKEKQKASWFKRAKAKVKKVMSEHPFWTAAGGAVIGSAATVGVAEVGKRVINSRQMKNQPTYVSEVSSLDPNVE